MSVSPDFWPVPIAHLAGAYVGMADEYIVVAEITDDPVNDFRGMRQLYTALVPVSEVEEALQASGAAWHRPAAPVSASAAFAGLASTPGRRARL